MPQWNPFLERGMRRLDSVTFSAKIPAKSFLAGKLLQAEIIPKLVAVSFSEVSQWEIGILYVCFGRNFCCVDPEVFLIAPYPTQSPNISGILSISVLFREQLS